MSITAVHTHFLPVMNCLTLDCHIASRLVCQHICVVSPSLVETTVVFHSDVHLAERLLLGLLAFSILIL